MKEGVEDEAAAVAEDAASFTRTAMAAVEEVVEEAAIRATVKQWTMY